MSSVAEAAGPKEAGREEGREEGREARRRMQRKLVKVGTKGADRPAKLLPDAVGHHRVARSAHDLWQLLLEKHLDLERSLRHDERGPAKVHFLHDMPATFSPPPHLSLYPPPFSPSLLPLSRPTQPNVQRPSSLRRATDLQKISVAQNLVGLFKAEIILKHVHAAPNLLFPRILRHDDDELFDSK